MTGIQNTAFSQRNGIQSKGTHNKFSTCVVKSLSLMHRTSPHQGVHRGPIFATVCSGYMQMIVPATYAI